MMRKVRIRTPVTENQVRSLELSDMVYIDGVIYTFRGRAFERLLKLADENKKFPVDFKESIHWHCGPIVKKSESKWVVASAGPTLSLRYQHVEPRAIKEWGIRLVIGEGGMGMPTVDAMKEYGAAYLSSLGGAGSLYAQRIKEVKDVHWLEMGMTEAIWTFEVENFGPLFVSIDSNGKSLYEKSWTRIKKNLAKVYESMNIDPEHDYYSLGYFGLEKL